MTERSICSVLCTLFIATPGSRGADAERTDPTDQLARSYPGISVRREGGDVLAIYGRPMTSGATPAEVAANWLNQYAGVFGVKNPDLRLVRAMKMGFGNATVFFYEQFIHGVRVDNARARVTVSHGDPSRLRNTTVPHVRTSNVITIMPHWLTVGTGINNSMVH